MAGEKKIKSDPKKPVNKGMLDEAVEAILTGMDNLLNDFRSKLDHRFDNVGDRFTKVEVELKGVKDEINGLKAELSATPSRGELEKIKGKIDRFHPQN